MITLAWRSLWRHRRRTLITLSSIGFGVALALFFMSMGEGVYAGMVRDLTRMGAGHVTLEHRGARDEPGPDLFIARPGPLRRELEALDEVRLTKAQIQGAGMARTGLSSTGVAIIGVEPRVERELSPVADAVTQGRYLQPGDEALAVIGVRMAKRLHLRVGKKMVLTVAQAGGDQTEQLCRVAGIFDSGSQALDSRLIQVPIGFARTLLGMPDGSVSQVGVLLNDTADQPRVIDKARRLTAGSPVAALGWQEVMPEVAGYIKVDRLSNWIFQGILLFLIMFTIFNTVLMSVLERSHESAVLLALGTNPWRLRVQVMIESAFLGLMGVSGGLVIGGAASYALQVYGLDVRSLMDAEIEVSGMTVDPILRALVTPGLVFGLGGVVLLSILVVALYPAWRAARVDVPGELR